MLSAYLDGELTDAERAEVETQLESSPEWREELAEVARGARRAARAPERDAPAGFWDAVYAHVAADADDDADDERGRPDHVPRRSTARSTPRRRVGVDRGARPRPSPRSSRSSCCRTAARCRPTWPQSSRSTARRVPTTATRSACWRRSVPSPGSADDRGEPGAAAPTGDARALHAGGVRGRVADRGVGRRDERSRRAGGRAARARDARRGRRPRLHRRGHDHVDDVEGRAVGAGAGDATPTARSRSAPPTATRSSTRAAAPTCATTSGWTGLVVEPTAHDLPAPDRRWALVHRRDPHGGGTSGDRGRWPAAPRRRRRRSGWRSTTPPVCCSRREVLGPDGAVAAVGAVHDHRRAASRARRRRTPPTGVRSPTAEKLTSVPDGYHAPGSPAGFELVTRSRHPDGVLLFYSDGVFTASVFEQQGDLDWGALPTVAPTRSSPTRATRTYHEAEWRRRGVGARRCSCTRA